MEYFMRTPKEILDNAENDVRASIEEVLKIEREYQNFRNLSDLNDKENELVDRILKYIRREIK